MDKISKRIKDGLKKKGMTQKELARRLGINRSSVGQWVSGRALPSLDKFLRIVEILDLDGFSGEKESTVCPIIADVEKRRVDLSTYDALCHEIGRRSVKHLLELLREDDSFSLELLRLIESRKK